MHRIARGIGLVAGSVSGTWGYRRELAGQGRQLRWQIPDCSAGQRLAGAVRRLIGRHCRRRAHDV